METTLWLKQQCNTQTLSKLTSLVTKAIVRVSYKYSDLISESFLCSTLHTFVGAP